MRGAGSVTIANTIKSILAVGPVVALFTGSVTAIGVFCRWLVGLNSRVSILENADEKLDRELKSIVSQLVQDRVEMLGEFKRHQGAQEEFGRSILRELAGIREELEEARQSK